jgi:hypothetical protein
MGGRRRLRGGLERFLPDHRTALGKALRREYRVLIAGYGVDGDPLLQREASRTALLVIRAREAAREWAELVERRRRGRGRRPGPRAVERAARRAALDDQTAAQALDRLRQRAGERRPLDLARAIAETQRKASP